MNHAPEAPDLEEIQQEYNVTAPPDTKTIFLGGIFIILLLTVMHVLSVIVIPFVLALVLKLVFQPVLRFLERLRIPRILASGLIIVALLSGVGMVGAALSDPATTWAAKFPASYSQIQQRLNFLRKPVEKTQKILVQAEDMTKDSHTKTVAVAVEGPHLSDKIIVGTQALAGGFFTTLLLLLFMLVSGDTFLRRFVEVLPRFKDKRQAVDISHQIERDLSHYLFTITVMNACVGAATGMIMWVFGVNSPTLWGMLAFLLNFIPIVGPLIAAAIFFFVGLLDADHTWLAFLPTIFYLAVHLLEGTLITPLLLAKRFILNPVLVVTSLIFWYWMWGIPGAILSMPMLAIVKIICDRIQRLSALGHFLEG